MIISGSNNESCSAQTAQALLTGSSNTVTANNGVLWPTSHDKVNKPFQETSTEHAQQISVWNVFWLNKLLEVSIRSAALGWTRWSQCCFLRKSGNQTSRGSRLNYCLISTKRRQEKVQNMIPNDYPCKFVPVIYFCAMPHRICDQMRKMTLSCLFSSFTCINKSQKRKVHQVHLY